MGSKRRASVKREGKRMFLPDSKPCYTYNGKVLADCYDRQCFLEGWEAESEEHYSAIRRKAEERAMYD